MYLANELLDRIEEVVHADQVRYFAIGWAVCFLTLETLTERTKIPFALIWAPPCLVRIALGLYGIAFVGITASCSPDACNAFSTEGHLEEGRFIALLLACGVEFYQHDENGEQFRVKFAGHGGGSGDGIAIEVPDSTLQPGR